MAHCSSPLGASTNRTRAGPRKRWARGQVNSLERVRAYGAFTPFKLSTSELIVSTIELKQLQLLKYTLASLDLQILRIVIQPIRVSEGCTERHSLQPHKRAEST